MSGDDASRCVERTSYTHTVMTTVVRAKSEICQKSQLFLPLIIQRFY